MLSALCSIASLGLLIFLFLLFGHLFYICGFQTLQFFLLGHEEAFVPYNYVIEFLPCYENIIEFLESFMFFVHHAKDPETVALDLLDEVSVEGQDLQSWKFL